MSFIEKILFGSMYDTYQFIMEKDPASKSMFTIRFCYPGLYAIKKHKLAHRLHCKGHTFIARLISQRVRRKTGIEIHPGAKIGNRVFIDHGMGVVIGETASVGDNCIIYQGVTLGGTGKDSGKRHPSIGSYVTIGAGAKVLGPISIGDYSMVGAGSVVLKDVPNYSTVVGNPGRVVKRKVPDKETILDQCNLPDPILHSICVVRKRLDKIEKKLDIVNKYE